MRTIEFVVLSLFVMVVACGGGSEGTGDDGTQQEFAATDTSGDEHVAEPEVVVSAEPDPIPSGPVEVTIAVKVGNDDAAATVSLVNEAGETAAEGPAGQAFTVQSGSYQVTATIGDASVLIDTPSQTQDAQLVPGEPQTVEVRFMRAMVHLAVTRNGRPIRHPEVTLFRQGSDEPAATFRVSNDHVPISPGRYEADVKIRGHEIRVSGLIFPDGATQNIPVNIE
jgi:hypothetical protein